MHDHDQQASSFSDIQPSTPWKSVHWTWADILLITVASIVIIFIGIFAFSALLTLTLGPTLTQHLTNATVLSVVSLALEFLALLVSVYWRGIRHKGLNWFTLGFRPVSTAWIWGALGLSVLVIPVGAIASYLASLALRQPLTNPQLQVLVPPDLTWFGVFTLIFLGGIAVPFVEELYFRGVLYSFIRERWGVWAGAIISALIFAISHFDIVIGAMAFCLGLFSALAYERSKSLWVSVLIHSASNTLKLLVLYFLVVHPTKIPFF